MLKKGERICPCCGKKLELIPPSRELLPDRFDESQNGVGYYWHSNCRLRSYTSSPRSNYTHGINNRRIVGDIGKTIPMVRAYIFTVNNTANKLYRDGISLFHYKMVFFCANCKAKLALNSNPFAIWGSLIFLAAYSIYALILFVTLIAMAGAGSFDILPTAICLILFSAAGIYSLISYITIKKYASNFVRTDAEDGLISPFIEVKASYGSLQKKYLRESNVFSAECGSETFYLYLVKKNEVLHFHICGVDGEPERMISLLRGKMDGGEKAVLPLTFEGKAAGSAEVQEIYQP